MFCRACNFELRGLPAGICPECGRGFDPLRPETFLAAPRSWMSRLLPRILLGVVAATVCALGVGVVLFINAARNAWRAEERLQAVRLIGELIAEHVEQSPTHAWPTSWADLEKLPPRDHIYAWPGEAAKFKAIVTIDFTVTTAEVLKQDPRTCTAVTVLPGPSFVGFPEHELFPLFERLRALPTGDD